MGHIVSSRGQTTANAEHKDTKMNLKNTNRFERSWPIETTLEQLTVLARKRLGSRFISVKEWKYGGGNQVEVRSVKTHYDGQKNDEAGSLLPDRLVLYRATDGPLPFSGR